MSSCNYSCLLLWKTLQLPKMYFGKRNLRNSSQFRIPWKHRFQNCRNFSSPSNDKQIVFLTNSSTNGQMKPNLSSGSMATQAPSPATTHLAASKALLICEEKTSSPVGVHLLDLQHLSAFCVPADLRQYRQLVLPNHPGQVCACACACTTKKGQSHTSVSESQSCWASFQTCNLRMCFYSYLQYDFFISVDSTA